MQAILSNGSTLVDLAWAAGIFEGEGCISKQGKSPRCSVSMSDEDVVRRLQSTLGIGSIHKTPRSHIKSTYKDLWTWTAGGFPSTLYVVGLLWRWLGERRRNKAEEILKWAMALPARRRSTCGAGHSLTDPSNVYQHPDRGTRVCKTCMNARSRTYYLKHKGE